MTKDELSDLFAQKNLIENQILATKIEHAKQSGKIVSSIDKLVCDKHPGAKFKAVKVIKNSYDLRRRKNKEGLSIYGCKCCEKDDTVFDKSKAHECPICGIVVGQVAKVPYRSSEESWGALAGSEGEHYHCKICSAQLGSYYWMYS